MADSFRSTSPARGSSDRAAFPHDSGFVPFKSLEGMKLTSGQLRVNPGKGNPEPEDKVRRT